MATNKQKLFMTYFLSKATFFGIGYSRLFNLSKSDTWISIILGMLLGIVIVWLIKIIMDAKKGLSLDIFLKDKTFINIVIKLLLICLCIYIFLEEIIILTSFLTSFFLLNTPSIVISIPIVIVVFYVLKKGLQPFLKTNEILFYISIFITIMTFLALSIYPHFDYLKPFLITKYPSILKSAFLYATYSSIPLLLITNLENNGKDLIKMYLVSTVRILLLTIFILTIFGPQLTTIYRFPEYIVLKRIKLLSFVEKIESLLSIIYIFDNYILMTMSAYTVKKLLGDNKISRISFPLMITIITVIGTIIFTDNYVLSLKNYYLSPYIYLGGYLIVLLLLFKAIKKKPKASNPS